MTDFVWKPLAEIELNICGSEQCQIYCLCSRVFIRSKMKGGNWEKLFIEKHDHNDADGEPSISVFNPDNQKIELQSPKKQEIEAVSCYCSASHYSTDDYESVMQSNSDHQNYCKDQFLPYPLQNSDSGADLSENFFEKTCKLSVEKRCKYSKSKVDIAWEKYWSENGENIIWKSWIEKYGAYINPNYLEQNSFCDNFDVDINDIVKEENINENDSMREDKTDITAQEQNTTLSIEFNAVKEKNFKETIEKIPDLKISSYSSCSNLSDIVDTMKTDHCADDLDTEDKILKSNSFGSYASYEKVRNVSADDEKFKNNDLERVRSRCSNTSLSVKSIANTTITTDSMTNVTKITLSSLDLSCEYESVRSSSLLSTSSDDSSRPSSTSSISSKEEICTEPDTWWRRVWKKHYEDQYTSSYQTFIDSFDETREINMIKSDMCEIEEVKKEILRKIDQQIETPDRNSIFESSQYFNSVGYALQRLNDGDGEPREEEKKIPDDEICSKSTSKYLENQYEHSDDRSDDLEEPDRKHQKLISSDKSYDYESSAKKEKTCRKVDNIKHAMLLMGFSFKANANILQSGSVTYRKKNIRGQNRRLVLSDSKPRTHLFFDDDANPYEVKRNESFDSLQFFDEEEEVCEKQEDGVSRYTERNLEPESLGYEAHSSSVEDNIEEKNESKKQRKRRKRQRKCSDVPQEIVDNKKLFKYWMRRYELFSKFDSGIKLDSESWFSVTPEKLAKHHAARCRCDVIVDAFCGAGGNSIQFAFTCERVIAIDIDPKKIELAKHNARIYGVEERIEFIVGDFMQLASNLQADVVFLSPPWGGPEYSSHDIFSLSNILPPLGGENLFRLAFAVTENVAYFLPKNINSFELSLLCGPSGEFEMEQNIMDRRLRSITAYFGGLIMDPEDPYL